MFDFKPDSALDTPERYRQLCDAADALTQGEPDAVANMANVAALLWEFLPDLNWAGFYRMGESASGDDELVLGPFVGRPACIRIPVHAFPGHIACDAASRSELVVPVVRDGKVIAVIDLDSPNPARFTAEDAQGVENLAALLSSRI